MRVDDTDPIDRIKRPTIMDVHQLSIGRAAGCEPLKAGEERHGRPRPC